MRCKVVEEHNAASLHWTMNNVLFGISTYKDKRRGPLTLDMLSILVNHSFRVFIPLHTTIQAHFESNYSSYYSNYSLIRTSIVSTIVLLEINGGSEHRYSSRLSGSLLEPYLTRWVQDLSVAAKLFVLENNYSLCTICGPTYSYLLIRVGCAAYEHHFCLQ